MRSENDSVNDRVYETLDWLEARLADQWFLVGSPTTEVDWRLFPTLVRFDAVCHGHFKCNRQRLLDDPIVWVHTRDLYQQPGIAETVDMEHIRKHYYSSQESVNPTRVVAIGPELAFNEPYGRETLP